MNFIAHKGVSLQDIDKVYSHPMALLQCAEYLSAYPHIKLIESDDTSASVEMIKKEGLKNGAAIASKKAAEMFDMEILDADIETNKKNYTRFLVLEAKQGEHQEEARKASLRVVTKHDPGALADVLSSFKNHNINLTKIQSMPIVGEPYRYAFNIDVVWTDYQEYQTALEEVAKSSENIIIPGEYKRGTIPQS